MVIKIKFNETDEPKEFTVAQEAKQYLTDNASSLTKGEGDEAVNSVFVSVHAEVDEDPKFSTFEDLEGAKEFIDAEVEAGSESEDEADDSEDKKEGEAKEDSDDSDKEDSAA